MLFYTGILMCVFAAAIIVSAITEGGPTLASRWENARWSKPLLLIACLTAFSFALEPLGFLLSSIPLMLAAVAGDRSRALDAGDPDRRAGADQACGGCSSACC